MSRIFLNESDKSFNSSSVRPDIDSRKELIRLVLCSLKKSLPLSVRLILMVRLSTVSVDLSIIFKVTSLSISCVIWALAICSLTPISVACSVLSSSNNRRISKWRPGDTQFRRDVGVGIDLQHLYAAVACPAACPPWHSRGSLPPCRRPAQCRYGVTQVAALSRPGSIPRCPCNSPFPRTTWIRRSVCAAARAAVCRLSRISQPAHARRCPVPRN